MSFQRKSEPITVFYAVLMFPVIVVIVILDLLRSLFSWIRDYPQVVRRSVLLQKLLEAGVVTAINTWPYHPHGGSDSIVTTWEVEGVLKGVRFVYSPESEDYPETRIGEIPPDVLYAIDPRYAVRTIERTARRLMSGSHSLINVKAPIRVLKKGAVRQMFMLMRKESSIEKVA